MTLTQADKQRLATAAKTSGTKIWFLSYPPAQAGTLEADQVALGRIQFAREARATLVEVIYTSAVIPA